jgi:GNAT superfamily N-acetyltransferase
MFALSRPERVSVRATIPGEGIAVAGLWRELWDAHEAWGGYPGSDDPAVYTELADRLDDDAGARAGHTVLGKHLRLVADLDGVPCGQVEGWCERHGVDPTTPFTCEVRSLIVTQRARGLGTGRALLDALAHSARRLSDRAPCLLAAEVLERNPAITFYERVGYRPIGYCARIDAAHGASSAGSSLGRPVARVALPRDAVSVACLDAMLAARRRAAGDYRFDPAKALDMARVDALAADFGSDVGGKPRNPAVLVCVDRDHVVRGAAFFVVHAVDPPFIPMRRALVGRFAVDPAGATEPVVMSLIALACRLALVQEAPLVEVADLPAPGTELHAAALAAGAIAWSRLMTKLV